MGVLLGRFLFSLVFFLQGIELFHRRVVDMMADVGLPWAFAVAPLLGCLAMTGALSVLLGYQAKKGSVLLAFFLLIITPLRYKFWMAGDFFSTVMHQHCFIKNVSLLGAALWISFQGAGPYSLDRYRD